MPSLIRWAHTQNDPCFVTSKYDLYSTFTNSMQYLCNIMGSASMNLGYIMVLQSQQL